MYSLCFKLYTNYTQNLTLNPTQNSTQRWQNPTQRAFRTLHSERSQNYTRGGTQTLHFVFGHELFTNGIRTRMERMERIVRNVCDERNESNERYKRNERKTGNENRRWRDSSLLQAAPKIQQFWAIFQRFDINIFNLREHFPPPNFAYSAHNFSLPSPN